MRVALGMVRTRISVLFFLLGTAGAAGYYETAPLLAAASSSLDSAAPEIRWDTGVRGTGVGSIACPRVQLLAVCGRDEP